MASSWQKVLVSLLEHDYSQDWDPTLASFPKIPNLENYHATRCFLEWRGWVPSWMGSQRARPFHGPGIWYGSEALASRWPSTHFPALMRTCQSTLPLRLQGGIQFGKVAKWRCSWIWLDLLQNGQRTTSSCGRRCHALHSAGKLQHHSKCFGFNPTSWVGSNVIFGDTLTAILCTISMYYRTACVPMLSCVGGHHWCSNHAPFGCKWKEKTLIVHDIQIHNPSTVGDLIQAEKKLGGLGHYVIIKCQGQRLHHEVQLHAGLIYTVQHCVSR